MNKPGDTKKNLHKAGMWVKVCIVFAVFAMMCATTPLKAEANQLKKKPNIVFVLVDNWGFGDISVQGSLVPTPHIDKLASEGLRLTNYNVESQCTPTRSAIHTGRMPIRSGTHKVTYGLPYGMASWEYTIAELLSDTGYKTALIGKWHLGDREGRIPTDQGYDEWRVGIMNTTDEAGYSAAPQWDPKLMGQPYAYQSTRGKAAEKLFPLTVKDRGEIDQKITDESVAYIKRHAKGDKPFYLYVGLTQVHPPMVASKQFDNASKAGVYSDILMQVDHHVGMMLDAVDEAGIGDDTIFILTGDNGTIENVLGGSNGVFRGGFTGYEGGMRTVGMLRWPKTIEAGRVSDEIVASQDWLPTLAKIVDAENLVPTDRPIDGVDQSDFMIGKKETSNREHIACYIGDDVFSFKWRNFKIHMQTAEDLFAPVQRYIFPVVYDVKNDPGEHVNLMVEDKFAYSWVYIPMGRILGAAHMSMVEYPNIKPGEDFQGYKK